MYKITFIVILLAIIACNKIEVEPVEEIVGTWCDGQQTYKFTAFHSGSYSVDSISHTLSWITRGNILHCDMHTDEGTIPIDFTYAIEDNILTLDSTQFIRINDDVI